MFSKLINNEIFHKKSSFSSIVTYLCICLTLCYVSLTTLNIFKNLSWCNLNQMLTRQNYNHILNILWIPIFINILSNTEHDHGVRGSDTKRWHPSPILWANLSKGHFSYFTWQQGTAQLSSNISLFRSEYQALGHDAVF